LKQLAMTNNTSGASIFDLGNIIKAESIAEVTGILKGAEEKTNNIRREEMAQQQQMQQEALAAKAEEERMKLEFEAMENEKDRQNDLTIAEIRAAGYGAGFDINQNQMSDYQDAMKQVKEDARYREDISFKKEQAAIKNSMGKSKLDIDREKLATERDIANKQLEIARVNKNKYDVKDEKNSKK